MYAESKDIVNQSADVVYLMLRDDMVKIVPYMLNIEKIEMLKYERTSDTRIEVMNHWHAKADVPSVIKSFIKPELMQWKDFAVWKDDEKSVDYRVESFVANNLYDLSGTNYIIPIGDDKTEIKVTFNLEIYPERLPGVPKFLAKRMKPAIEKFLQKLLTPNLTAMAKGLNEYFAANPPEKKKAAKKSPAKKTTAKKTATKKTTKKKSPSRKK